MSDDRDGSRGAPLWKWAATVAVLCGAATCAHLVSWSPDTITLMRPGMPGLRSPVGGARAADRDVSRLRPHIDSLLQPLTVMRTFEGPIDATGHEALLVSAWPNPYASTDSLVIDRRTMAPVRERLSIDNDRYEYEYAGARVTGTVTAHGAEVRHVDRRYPGSVFGFNELEALVRALPYRAGLRAVVPLFSEVDADVEYDTLTVTGSTKGAGGAVVWNVQFADPAITAVYAVDDSTRRIVEYTTRNRRTHTEYHVRAR